MVKWVLRIFFFVLNSYQDIQSSKCCHSFTSPLHKARGKSLPSLHSTGQIDYLFILYYLGCGSDMRYHDGVLHFREPRLHVRLILIQQELSIAASCVDMNLKIEKPSSVTSKTSRPTRNIGFCFKCSTRATSSITGPLLQLTRIASYGY